MAATPTDQFASCMAAAGQTTVMFPHLPPCKKSVVSLSGLLPSDLDKPLSSLVPANRNVASDHLDLNQILPQNCDFFIPHRYLKTSPKFPRKINNWVTKSYKLICFVSSTQSTVVTNGITDEHCHIAYTSLCTSVAWTVVKAQYRLLKPGFHYPS